MAAIVSWVTNRFLSVALPLFALPLLLAWAATTFLLRIAQRTLRWLRFVAVPPSWPRSQAVVITGAASGIGEHLAYECAHRRACVLLSDIRGSRVSDVAQRCRQIGAEGVEVVEADVRDERECRRIVERAVNAFGKLDLVCCNAGILHTFQIKDTQSAEGLENVMDTDFYGSMWLALHSLPYLRRTNGRLLVTASLQSFLPLPYAAAYNAAKGALVQLFDTMRSEPVGADVSITVAFPGPAATEMTAGKVLDERGRMVVDARRREAFVGPTPLLHPSTIASTLLSAAFYRQHYVLVPAWGAASLLFRLFAPELLSLALRLTLLPVVPGVPPLSQLATEPQAVRTLLFSPPAVTQEQAEGAVQEGKGEEEEKGIRERKGEAGRPEAASAGQAQHQQQQVAAA